jgi:ATP-GRASP peptide maturase of grasp-with-spasm system
MLLILSDEYDATTDKVIDWLNYYNVSYIRMNDSSIIKKPNIQIDNKKTNWSLEVNESFSNDKITLLSENITRFWYRRGELTIRYNLPKSLLLPNDITFELQRHINNNTHDVIHFLYHNLNNIPHIGSFYDNNTVKVINLQVAKKIGLAIPSTIITDNKITLMQFLGHYKNCITKGIRCNNWGVKNQFEASCLTQFITLDEIMHLPDFFAPSLLQEYIDKWVELRIFYIDRVCYTAAIFSQQDEQTKVDFRNYNEEKPNRIIPYKLPNYIESKLILLMSELGMKSGSIDMLINNNEEYLFLEVNPIGQFVWISDSCNYNLEKILANYFNN